MKIKLLNISPVIMIIGGFLLLVASKLAKYIAIALILIGIVLLGLSLL